MRSLRLSAFSTVISRSSAFCCISEEYHFSLRLWRNVLIVIKRRGVKVKSQDRKAPLFDRQVYPTSSTTMTKSLTLPEPTADKKVVISVLASIATVQCGTILTPVIGKLVSEKVVEAHSSNVVHPSASLVAAASPALLRYADVALVQQPVAEIVQPVAKTSLVAEKTIEAHGHQVIHDARPLIAVAKPLAAVESHVAVPAIATREIAYTAPYYSPYYSAYPHQLIAEKIVSNYGHTIQHA
ncbi:hypothetical protein G5I_06079 [Acromyrmex echinatior]|uniref:Uncharacterized protein n=1 Tax=Acromyrmex echinatior TaxID=103372 RepID=F4WK36_ACREC|nr:hypothetical protein G5I_06079 [Acromyrmex echinatior]